MTSKKFAPGVLVEWSIFGIPIHVDASWLVVAAFVTWSLSRGYFPEGYPGFHPAVYWAMGGSAALLLFASVLLHELGHSLAAKGYGIPVTRVVLFIFGGVAQIARDPRRPMIELAVALAGPLVSVLIASACLWVSSAVPITGILSFATAAIAHYLAALNTWVLLFNLLPGFPLDGGRILRALLWAWTGSFRKATRLASLSGLALGIGLMGLGVWVIIKQNWVTGLWYLYLGSFLRRTAQMSYRQAAS